MPIELRRGDVVMMRPPARPRQPPGSSDPIMCLNELVAALTGTPYTHCAIVTGADENGVAQLAHSTLEGISIVPITLFGGAPVVVRRGPEGHEDEFAQSAADMATELGDGEPQAGDWFVGYAPERMLLSSLLLAGRYSEELADEYRQLALGLATMTHEYLEGLLEEDDGLSRYMCAEFAASVDPVGAALGASGPLDQEALDAAHAAIGIDQPTLQENYVIDCLGVLQQQFMRLAQKVLELGNLPAGAAEFFARTATPGGAAELAATVAAAADDPDAAQEILQTLHNDFADAVQREKLVSRRHQLGLFDPEDDPGQPRPELFVNVADLLATTALGAMEIGSARDCVFVEGP